MDSFDLHKGFAVAWISRADLTEYFSDEAIATLTDADMKRIAAMMEDLYHDTGYWEDLLACANRVFAEKEKDNGLT